jgi:transposase-like protein
MSKKHHKVAPEVKADILKRIKDDGLPVAQAAEEHGITTTAIYKWLGGGVKAAPSWSEFSRIRREKDELLRIVGELTVRMGASQKKVW